MTNSKFKPNDRKLIIHDLPDIKVEAVTIGKPGYNRRNVEKLTQIKKSSAKRRPFGKRK